jgi:hypothetical protein
VRSDVFPVEIRQAAEHYGSFTIFGFLPLGQLKKLMKNGVVIHTEALQNSKKLKFLF